MALGLGIVEMRPESLVGAANCGQFGLFTCNSRETKSFGVWSLIRSFSVLGKEH